MLAEKTSSTKSTLPKALQDKAHLLSGEYAWAALDALSVVEWLLAHNIAVVGVELWRNQRGFAQWIATSNYSAETPVDCAHAAVQFITEFQQREPFSGNLFNLTIG